MNIIILRLKRCLNQTRNGKKIETGVKRKRPRKEPSTVSHKRRKVDGSCTKTKAGFVTNKRLRIGGRGGVDQQKKPVSTGNIIHI